MYVGLGRINSEPVFLTSDGYDLSLFHDDNDRKWLLNVSMDYCSATMISGIMIQEYLPEQHCLSGTPVLIYKGTSLGTTEAPNLYKRNGWYYLITAEGGTGYKHAVTTARCRTVDGMYETGPDQPLLTSYGNGDRGLQKAGHASLTDSPSGEWYLVHLCARPVGKEKMCILGRETALQKLQWTQDGWPKLENGTKYPDEMIELLEAKQNDIETVPIKMDHSIMEEFDGEEWDSSFQTLRQPLGKRASLTARPGYLRLFGGNSLHSHYEQSILAHRQQEFYTETTTRIDFLPESFLHMAGLVYYYDTLNYYYLYITRNKEKKKIINLLCSVFEEVTFPIGEGILIPEDKEVYLKLKTECETARFSYSFDGKNYQEVEHLLDATVLSDDYYQKKNLWRFTGAFVGICCQDMCLKNIYADFNFFEYKECQMTMREE